MSVFSHSEFDNHQQVAFFNDKKTGLKAIIAVHNTNLGPALGGCRMWPYATEDEALTDVLRLSRGMTYKSALANLKLGGGKAVIIGDPRTQKSDDLLYSMGDFIQGLAGRYITAEDSGTSVADILKMAKRTSFISGVDSASDHGGDPSPSTAYGVFVSLREAVTYRLGRANLEGLKVAIQGLGNVGYRLAVFLHKAGARLYVTDIVQANVDRAVRELDATAVAGDKIFALDVDVFAPCARRSMIRPSTNSKHRLLPVQLITSWRPASMAKNFTIAESCIPRTMWSMPVALSMSITSVKCAVQITARKITPLI
jgi:leucine dehydrogenase